MLIELFNATLETVYMVFVSGFIAFALGLPLGTFLHTLKPQGLFHYPLIFRVLNIIINAVRSIPYIIFMISIIPITRFLVGSSIGTTASIVPLTLCAIPFVAKQVELALSDTDPKLIDTLQSFGFKPLQIIIYGMLLEARIGIVQVITITLVTLLGYSAMAGAIGGGGLGSLAINYGYNRFELNVLVETILILIVLVQLIQFCGDYIVSRYKNKFG